MNENGIPSQDVSFVNSPRATVSQSRPNYPAFGTQMYQSQSVYAPLVTQMCRSGSASVTLNVPVGKTKSAGHANDSAGRWECNRGPCKDRSIPPVTHAN